MNYKLAFVGFLSFMFAMPPSVSWAGERIITVTSDQSVVLRAHSARHANTGARKMQALWGPAFADGCTSVYLYSEDDAALYATLLLGYSTKMTFDLYYETDASVRGPWGDSGSCLLTSVTLHR